eukprot:7227631-Pyramimonas_sp.AAC.1
MKPHEAPGGHRKRQEASEGNMRPRDAPGAGGLRRQHEWLHSQAHVQFEKKICTYGELHAVSTFASASHRTPELLRAEAAAASGRTPRLAVRSN